MKSKRARRIMWEVGWWQMVTRPGKKPERRWTGRLIRNSRAEARTLKLKFETIRRLEAVYVDAGD